jgi:hypothetical protein
MDRRSKMLAVLLWLSFLYGCYNGVATALFGGFTPAVSTSLIGYTGGKPSRCCGWLRCHLWSDAHIDGIQQAEETRIATAAAA